jgi:hypothetical protein
MNNRTGLLISSFWLALKIAAILLLMNSGQTFFVYQNF